MRDISLLAIRIERTSCVLSVILKRPSILPDYPGFFLLLLMTIFFLSVKKRFLTDKTLADGRFITAQIEIVIIYWLTILEKI